MICPQCKAEYRRGFTICADCEVPLVESTELAARNTADDEADSERVAGIPGDPNTDPFCSFWKGDDPRIHAELCTVLDEAEIGHKTVFRQDHLFNLSNYPTFQIGVPASLFEKAEAAVKEAFVLDPSASDVESALSSVIREIPDRGNRIRRLPPMLSPPENETLPGPPGPHEGKEWIADDASLEIWSGEAPYLDQVLLAALHENDIAVRQEARDGKAFLFVLPKDEERAKEIVREIVEGQPPE